MNGLCRAAGISRAGYYRFRQRGKTKRTRKAHARLVICDLAAVGVVSAGVAAKVHPDTQVEPFYFLAALIFAQRAR